MGRGWGAMGVEERRERGNVKDNQQDQVVAEIQLSHDKRHVST